MEKAIAPWNVKPGMKAKIIYPGGLERVSTVKQVIKTRGTFTAATIWRVLFIDGEHMSLYGRERHGDRITPASKFYVYTEEVVTNGPKL